MVVSPNDPEAMLRHTEECRTRGYPFVADPSQQLAWMDGPSIRLLVEGAAYLFSNEYEAALLEKKTGWSSDEVLDRVGVRITTLGRHGARIEQTGLPGIHVPVAAETDAVDPTGVGDAFRAGFLAGGRLEAARSSGRPRSVPCSRPTSSRPSAHRSTSSGVATCCADWGRPTATELSPTSNPTW